MLLATPKHQTEQLKISPSSSSQHQLYPLDYINNNLNNCMKLFYLLFDQVPTTAISWQPKQTILQRIFRIAIQAYCCNSSVDWQSGSAFCTQLSGKRHKRHHGQLSLQGTTTASKPAQKMHFLYSYKGNCDITKISGSKIGTNPKYIHVNSIYNYCSLFYYHYYNQLLELLHACKLGSGAFVELPVL